MENSTFNYQYSAKRNKEVERIRSKYLPREVSKLELLKSLDFKVSAAGHLAGLIIGIVGVLIFGVGMCFGLDVFQGAVFLPILLLAIGTAIMITAYPVYKRISGKVRAELAPKILVLSEEIING